VSKEDQTPWVIFTERIFSISFIAFSFVMFSCLFPTGFSATFSTIAFLSALPIFFYRIRFFRLNPYERIGLVLFGWLLISISWSVEPLLDSVGLLSEYRIYLMLPLFIAVLAFQDKTRHLAFVAAIVGAIIALFASYGLSLDWLKVDGATLSLGNRIYHGFIMSILLLGCLLVARESTGLIRMFAATTAILVLYNVLNVENGRTGYLQVFMVCLTFLVLTFAKVRLLLSIVCLLAIFLVMYLSFDRLGQRVDQTISNAVNMIVYDDYASSAGYRLEFYKGAIHIGLENPLTGVGVGDVPKTLQMEAEKGGVRALTDNVHSEFLNMLVVGGFPALFLFASFIGSIIFSGMIERHRQPLVGDALIGVGIIIFVSALFNSTIKDYGEKHALMIVLSILGAYLVARAESKR